MDSKLQIISGMYRGRKLTLPAGTARPTQNRARIALFNMLMPMLDVMAGLTVWDAFAGSGAFGIECMSRLPNVRAIFTDVNDTSIRAIRKNVGDLMASRATIIHGDAVRNVSKYGAIADVVFVDAPYAMVDVSVRFMQELGTVACAGTIVIWETDATSAVVPDSTIWDVVRDKQYGRARFLIMRRRGN